MNYREHMEKAASVNDARLAAFLGGFEDEMEKVALSEFFVRRAMNARAATLLAQKKVGNPAIGRAADATADQVGRIANMATAPHLQASEKARKLFYNTPGVRAQKLLSTGQDLQKSQRKALGTLRALGPGTDVVDGLRRTGSTPVSLHHYEGQVRSATPW